MYGREKEKEEEKKNLWKYHKLSYIGLQAIVVYKNMSKMQASVVIPRKSYV